VSGEAWSIVESVALYLKWISIGSQLDFKRLEFGRLSRERQDLEALG
jgi:hypothetical protein